MTQYEHQVQEDEDTKDIIEDQDFIAAHKPKKNI